MKTSVKYVHPCFKLLVTVLYLSQNPWINLQAKRKSNTQLRQRRKILLKNILILARCDVHEYLCGPEYSKALAIENRPRSSRGEFGTSARLIHLTITADDLMTVHRPTTGQTTFYLMKVVFMDIQKLCHTNKINLT